MTFFFRAYGADKHRIVTNRKRNNARLRRAVAMVLGASATFSAVAIAQPATGAGQDEIMDTIDVIDFRGRAMSSLRYTRELLDTPRIITVLPADLLEQQNVTSMRDAMRNIPGISLQAGEGNPPGGDQLKIRGFNARDDINVNGVRDLGNYFRDPFYVDQVEVVKGPNSTFAGRGSAGGTVNFVTRSPMTRSHRRLEVSGGTDDYLRGTVDFNHVINSNSAIRVNAMVHDADVPGRDVVNDSRYGLFSAYTWGFNGDTQITADWLHSRQDNIEDKGLPFDREGFSGPRALCDDPTNNQAGRVGNQRCGDGYYTGVLPEGINFSSYFGHVDDYQKVDVDIFGIALDHVLTDDMHLRNSLRYSRVHNDSITSSPRIKVPTENWGSGDFSAALVQGDIKPRDQRDEGLYNQTDISVSFQTGQIQHDLITGVEMGRFSYDNQRRPDVNGSRTSLLNPESRTRPDAPYDGTVHRYESNELAFFLLDTLAFSPEWELNLGLRWDRVTVAASDRGWADPIDLERTDRQLSYSAGLVYKPVENISYYASFGSAFEISGTFDRNQVQLAGGGGSRITDENLFNVAPEVTQAYELGVKWRPLAGLDVNAALFRTDKTKARLPGLGADDPSVLDTNQRIDGFELLVAGQVSSAWKLYGGYTYLDSEVRRSAAFPELVGQQLGGTPEHSFNVFTTYDFTSRFTFGGGLQYASEQISAPQTVISTAQRRRNVSIDSSTVVDLYAIYRFTDRAQLRVNAFNILDEAYISQMAEGGAQGIPGKARHLIATLRYDF